MAFKIVYTEKALADLEAVLEYIRRESPDAAERFGSALLNHLELLTNFPALGAPVPRRKTVRKLFQSPIRVY